MNMDTQPVTCPRCHLRQNAMGAWCLDGGFAFSHQCLRCELEFDDETPLQVDPDPDFRKNPEAAA